MGWIVIIMRRPGRREMFVDRLPCLMIAHLQYNSSNRDSIVYLFLAKLDRIRRGIDIDAGCGQLTVKVSQDDVLGKGLL